MIRHFKPAYLIILAVLLTGCGQNVKQVLSNIDHDCERHYSGSLSSGIPPSGAVTFQIDCKPRAEIVPAK